VAADVTSAELAPADPSPPGRIARPHRWRFLFVYGTLAAVLGVGIAGIVFYAGRSISPAPTWSTWKPSGGGLGAAKQIADHVAGTYHLPSGQQLVDVIAKAPSVSPANQQIPIHFIAVRGTKGANDSTFPVDSSNSLMFSLCGLGQACSISAGKPSVERGRLVRREILELALYTFKYVGGVSRVIAFMPPPAGNPPQYAVYLQKRDLSQQLKMPLARTLNAKVPAASKINAREQQTIDATTQSKIFKFTLSQSQQGDVILVLAPLAA
jgi:hypothetical protein